MAWFKIRTLSIEELIDIINSKTDEFIEIDKKIRFYEEKNSILTKNIISLNNTIKNGEAQIQELNKDPNADKSNIIGQQAAIDKDIERRNTDGLELAGNHKSLSKLYADEKKLLDEIKKLDEELKGISN